MIRLRLSGGLGNQLFQLAAAALLAKNQQTNVTVFANGTQKYKVVRDPDSLDLLARNEWLVSDTKHHFFSRWASVEARVGRLIPFIGINDKNYWYAQNNKSQLKTMFLDGYFQRGWDLGTFDKAVGLLAVKPASAVAGLRTAHSEAVIHIRGGDFLALPQYKVVDADYYLQSVLKAKERGLNQFAVMTDDYEYAGSICEYIRKIVPTIAIRMMKPGVNTLEDFDTLRSASARIIGNSTFAWWASALCLNSAPTWSPKRFTTDHQRDFFLRHERTL